MLLAHQAQQEVLNAVETHFVKQVLYLHVQQDTTPPQSVLLIHQSVLLAHQARFVQTSQPAYTIALPAPTVLGLSLWILKQLFAQLVRTVQQAQLFHCFASPDTIKDQLVSPAALFAMPVATVKLLA